jgi:hypothetical protein
MVVRINSRCPSVVIVMVDVSGLLRRVRIFDFCEKNLKGIVRVYVLHRSHHYLWRERERWGVE